MTSASIISNLEDKSAKAKLADLFKLVDQEKRNLVQLLKDAVSIPSIAHEPEHFPDIIEMVSKLKFPFSKYFLNLFVIAFNLLLNKKINLIKL